jgi:hypothetical protein
LLKIHLKPSKGYPIHSSHLGRLGWGGILR